MMWGYHGFGLGAGLLGGGLMMLVWLLVIVAALVLFARVFGGGRGATCGHMGASETSSPALRIAEERYARGEISAQELAEIREQLR